MAGHHALQHSGLLMPNPATLVTHAQNAHHLGANMLHQQLQVEHPLLHFLDSSTTVSTVVGAAAAAQHQHQQQQQQQQQQQAIKEQYQNSDRCSQLSNNSSYKGECPDRPFVCGICRRAFSQQSTLTNHLKTHTGEKPYKCKICESHFRQLSTLNNHMKIHTGEKPYSCSYCPKQFRQKSTLTNHIRIHTC